MIGISLNFLLSEFRGAQALAERLRAGGFAGLLVIGGVAATFLAERLMAALPGADAVCLGEAEQVLPT